MRNTQAPGLPSLHQHHHHSMNNSIGGHLPGPGPQHSLAPHPNIGRPGIDRAHTFPTPPTSASSVMGNMGNSDGSFQWGQQGMGSVQQGTNPLSIDTGLSNARSMPTTPATTPPGSSIQSMQQYQQSTQPYDSSRQMYSAPPPQQNAYSQQPVAGQQDLGRYEPSNSYIKNEMGPPSTRAPGESEHHDGKDSNGMLHHGQSNGQVSHGQGDDEADHEHDAEYTHGNSATYDTNRQPYTYANGSAVGSLQGEHAHLSPEMTGSPNHQAGSGRATPRTAAPPQPYYSQQQPGYSTPPRIQPPSSNLYNVMSSERGTANNGATGGVYAPQSDLNTSVASGYAVQQPMNGTPGSNKRGRDDDDESRPSSRGPGADPEVLKRRKTIHEASVSETSFGAPLNRARSTIAQRRR